MIIPGDKDRTSKFGGECDVNNVHFKAYASPARDVPDDATIGDKKQPLLVTSWSCYESTPADNPFGAPFRRAAMSTHINDTCHNFPTWAGGNHTKIASNDPNVLLHISTTPLKKEIPFLESDCLKGYNMIVLDRCKHLSSLYPCCRHHESVRSMYRAHGTSEVEVSWPPVEGVMAVWILS